MPKPAAATQAAPPHDDNSEEDNRTQKEIDKELFLKKLEEFPVVTRACALAGVSKASIYRWREEDPAFKKALREARRKGLETACDLAEATVFVKAQSSANIALRLLSIHHPAYGGKAATQDDDLTPEQEQQLKEMIDILRPKPITLAKQKEYGKK